MRQLACVFSTIVQDIDGSFAPHFVGSMQAGESFSGSIDTLPDGTTIPNVKDFVPGDNDLVTASGLTLCYVWADEARITAADGNANYIVLWRTYIDADDGLSSQEPGDNMTGAELTAISNYLVLHTGRIAGTISQWLINQFEVTTQQEAVSWSTSRPRTATIAKLMTALSRYAEAQAEFDGIEA